MVTGASQETLQPRKRRGPAPTGKGEPVQVRLQPDQLAKLDAWIDRQEPRLSRPEAIRRLLATALNA
ncbi:ribbon-helix-helix protein, CopG family [Sphingomonas dokdonensis]|uniref:ribbon-helix-helix protein, CopG family n=1 Tax=Sphingomonas dokdonensis TaxID=344880 RepID=UPI000B4B7B25|nr:ribbon-helix-helix protein, CopG family [Sphingomonas dokdonensis]